MILSKIASINSNENVNCSRRKRKVRGLFGYWTEALYSIDIDHFDSFLKQQKKDSKNGVKYPSQTSIASNATTSNDPDEELPDVDPLHEQLNLPQNSITLWRILPKLDYSPQVKKTKCSFFRKIILFFVFFFRSITIFHCLQWL